MANNVNQNIRVANKRKRIGVQPEITKTRKERLKIDKRTSVTDPTQVSNKRSKSAEATLRERGTKKANVPATRKVRSGPASRLN
jgi:hypothetical protein